MSSNDPVFGLVVSVAMKNPCRIASTGPIADLSGLLTIDDIDLALGDRILVKDQDDPIDNGIYVADVGAWPRARDCDGTYDLVRGTLVKVYEGTTQVGFWECLNEDPVIGVDALSFGLASGGLGAVSGFAQTLLDDTSAAQMRTTLELEAGAAGDIWAKRAGDTFTGTVTFSSLVNISDTALVVRGSSDTSRQMRFDTKGILPATQRIRYNADEDSKIGVEWTPVGLRPVFVVAANAFTLSIRDSANIDLAGSNPGIFKFRSTTQASGQYSTIVQQSALTMTVSAGSTLGTVNGVPARIYFGVADDAGTARLFVYNPWDSVNNVLVPLDDSQLYSSTAEGGAGGADSPLVLYSGSAFSSKHIKILGYIEVTQATAGQWASGATKLHMVHHGDPTTGYTVQRARIASGDVASGTTATPIDDTIPQSTEGTSFLAVTLTPSKPHNMLRLRAKAELAASTTASMVMAMHSTAASNALVAQKCGILAQNECRPYSLEHQLLAGTTNSQTYTIRVGAPTTGTVITLNGESTARLLGGAMNSFIEVEEIFV